MKKRFLFVLSAIALCFAVISCAPKTTVVDGITVAAGKGQAKYVFVFVGDGMSNAHFAATEYYLATKDNPKNFGLTRLNFTKFPVMGLANTHDFGSLITDSASAGTAFASGRKTLSSMINVDPRDGRTPYKTIAEYAQEAGMKIGMVSTVTLTHATPAAYFAKINHRNNTEGNANEPVGIAQQLYESGFDYFAGGWLVPNSDNNDRHLNEARRLGYTVTRTPAEFNALNRNSGKVIALAERVQDSGAMHYEIDRRPTDLSLVDFTRKGIELLENPKGFFLMVEGGKIDWAGHANDAGAVIHDILALDASVKLALDFYERYPKETLIIMIGDHETGGMVLGWAGTTPIPAEPGVSANLGMGYSLHLDRISRQTRSYVAFDDEIIKPYKERVSVSQRRFDDLFPAILESFGIDLRPASLNVSQFQKNQIEIAFRRTMELPVNEPQEGWAVFHGGYEALSLKLVHVLGQSAGIGWTSFSHTAAPVPTFAFGAHQEIFGGYYDNTEIFYKLASAMNLKVQ
ncbi:MAG: alkaline phosphatase [Treponema sp.]|nr:alkaline phosphatase [Treponema sp.]